jgi:malonyl-CoA O-methyltransferase
MRSDFARAARILRFRRGGLAREVGARMAQRLDLVKIAPQRVADIGCATGDGIRELQRRYPKAQPLAIAIDYALPMLLRRAPAPRRAAAPHGARAAAAQCRCARLAAGGEYSLGLVWSNLMLHWLDDPLPAFRELQRVLEVGGLLCFATLGPDTLKELREASDEESALAIRRSASSTCTTWATCWLPPALATR